MDVDIRSLAVGLLEPGFYGRSLVVSLAQSHASVHPHVEVDGIMASDAPGAQVMGLGNAVERQHDAGDVALDVVRQRTFQQLVYTFFQLLHGHLNDEEAHYYRRQRVEHAPVLSQKDGSPDADGRAYGRERVAPMVPGVGYHGRAVEAFPHDARAMEQRFLRHDGNQRRHESNPSGRLQAPPVEKHDNLFDAAPAYPDAHN